MGSVERARLAICSAKAGGPCGRTAPSPGESDQGEHVHDLDREHLASGKLYPPLMRTVARAREPPSFTPTHLAAARHAPEGPRAARSCDGCAAPLALSGSGERGHDVLSAQFAQLEAGSSDRAVVTRERRWLVEEWNGRAGACRERLQEACGSGHRCSPRPPPSKPSTIRCSPDLVPSMGPSGAAWGSR